MNKPLKGWRRALRRPVRYLGKFVRFCCGFHHIKVNGKKASKDEATIFVAAPHSSFFDLFLAFEMGFPCCVSKAENAEIPIVGFLVRAMQPILVTRYFNCWKYNNGEYLLFIFFFKRKFKESIYSCRWNKKTIWS